MFTMKRIIGTITIKNGIAVQSFGYKKYLPLGSPSCLAENLDRWGVDEIIILDMDRSINNLGPNLDLIESVSSIPISTPLIYAGGIRNIDDATKAIESGAERIVVDFLLNKFPNNLKLISEVVGVQSIISSIPVILNNDDLYHYDYNLKQTNFFNKNLLELIKKYTSESLIIDVKNDGNVGKFDIRILDKIVKFALPVICYGGIDVSKKTESILNEDKVSAVALDNVLNYTELPVKKLRDMINKSNIRKPDLSIIGI